MFRMQSIFYAFVITTFPSHLKFSHQFHNFDHLGKVLASVCLDSGAYIQPVASKCCCLPQVPRMKSAR